MEIFKNLSPYPYVYALKNGGFISWDAGAAPMSDSYCFFIFDCFEEEIYNISFSKYHLNKNGICDNDDEYWFGNVRVSKETWEELSVRYLYVDDMEGNFG